MYVCLCNRITKKDLDREIDSISGSININDLKKRISIGSNCGSCLNYISQNFDNITSPSDLNNLYYSA